MELRDAGKRTEALLALKKSKNDEKLLASANAALETLSSQQDMLENAKLQKELASALASTTKSIKSKTKGLVKFAEKAVAGSQDLRDDAEDLNAAFEGIQPTFNGDDDELLEELNELMGENNPPTAASMVQVVADSVVKVAAASLEPSAFPSVPNGTLPDECAVELPNKRAERKAAKQPLLAGGVAVSV